MCLAVCTLVTHHVILCLESVGVRIHALVCDAGGGNKSFFTLLINKRINKHKAWLDEDEVSFPNPFDTTRRVFIVFCSVHGIKACKNNLERSGPGKGKSKNFFSGGINFGIKQVQNQHKRGDDDTGRAKVTRIDRIVAYPDKFSRMCVSDAKKMFEFKALVHEANWIAEEINAVDDLKVAAAESCMLNAAAEDTTDSTDKDESKRLELLFNILTRKMDGGGWETASADCKSAFKCLAYRIQVHKIFMQHFLNKDACLVLDENILVEQKTKNTVEEFTNSKKDALEFFIAWQAEAEAEAQICSAIFCHAGRSAARAGNTGLQRKETRKPRSSALFCGAARLKTR